MNQVEIFKALSNKSRLQILTWLKDPELNFPLQAEVGFTNGICVGYIQERIGLTQSTVSEYLTILQHAGLLTVTRKGQWTYYKRNEEAFKALGELIKTDL